MGITGILCSLRLALEGKEVPEESLRFEFLKFLANNFRFIRCRRQYLWTIIWRRYGRFTFVENTFSNSFKVTSVKFLGSDRVFCFISISKFCCFLCFWTLLYFKFYLVLFKSFKGILSNMPLFFLVFIYLFIYLFIYCILLTVTWLIPCYSTWPLDLDGHFTQPLMFLLFEIFNCAVELRLIKR